MHFSRKLMFVSLKVVKSSGFYAILMYLTTFCTFCNFVIKCQLCQCSQAWFHFKSSFFCLKHWPNSWHPVHFSRKLIFVYLKVVKSSGFCSTFILQHSVLFATLWWNASIASVPRPDSTLSQASFCLKDWPKRLQTLHFSRKLIFVSLKVVVVSM